MPASDLPRAHCAPRRRATRSAVWLLLATALALGALPGAALANVNVNFQVVNDRGIPQVASWSSSTGAIGRTDGFGKATINVAPGDTISFTRFYVDQCGGVPEGKAGVPFTVPAGTADGASETITVPSVTGPAYHPELSDAERWLVGKLNQDRAAHGQQPLVIATTLNDAADATARQSALQRAQSGSYPFPPAYCTVLLADWGWPVDGGYGSDDAATTDPAAALAHWTDGSMREQMVTAPFFNAIGIGDGGGSFIVDLATCPMSDPAASRCGLTTDQGDASIQLPGATGGGSTTTSGGGGPTTTSGGGGPSTPGGGTGTAPSHEPGKTCPKASRKRHHRKGAKATCPKPKKHKRRSALKH